MIKKVVVYETKNGRHHETLEAAKKHVADNICQTLENYLKPILKEKGGIDTATDLFKVIEFLAGDYEKATMLAVAIDFAFEEVEDDTETEDDCCALRKMIGDE